MTILGISRTLLPFPITGQLPPFNISGSADLMVP